MAVFDVAKQQQHQIADFTLRKCVIRATQRQSVRSSRSETTDFTFDEEAATDGSNQRSTLIRRDVTFSE